MSELINKKSAVIPIDETSPIAFINVYEKGDIWIKIQGCEKCPDERRRLCCGNCPMLTPDGWCSWQVGEVKNSSKPLYCVLKPYPDNCKPDCSLIYECIKGKHKGKIRHISDKQGVFK